MEVAPLKNIGKKTKSLQRPIEIMGSPILPWFLNQRGFPRISGNIAFVLSILSRALFDLENKTTGVNFAQVS